MGYAPMASYPVSITTGGSTVPADFRLLEYYQKKVSWTNTAAARFEQVLVESDPTHAGSEKQLWVFLPKDPEAFTHDVEGNLLQDGRWNYGWDGENRLIWMESRTDLPTAMPRQRVEFGYDFMSRRNVKRMYIPVSVAEIPGGPLDEPQTVGSTTSVIDGATASVAGPGSDAAPETLPAWAVSAPVGWSQVGLSKYVWDGWNLLAELDISDASVRTFAWGLDLSGSEQGAGGIGGLVLGWTRANGTLGGEVNGTGGNTLRYVFDGNGNVMAALDDLGRVRAKYEYGPFGETLTSEGDLAADNPIRWSTKYTDGESGLVYYGYRYYNAGTGRWLNRDPVAEAGGVNLFGFVNNATSGLFDALGLWTRDSWTGSRGSYTGTATAECDDDLGTLAYLITGVRSDRYELSIRSVKAGDVVDIAPLLKMLERRLRLNVVAATNKFSTSGAVFGTPTKRPETESGINAWFRGSSAAAPADPIECKLAAMMVLTEGLILTLQPGEFDEYFGGKGVGVFGTPLRRDFVTGLQDIRNGDWFWFSNSAEYADLFPSGAWARENVIKVGTDRFYGFPGGRHSEGEWKQKLLDQLNSGRRRAGKPPADLSAIPGFDQDKVTFIDVPKVGMKTFDERKKKL
jgi:RHS repeat-associated protein